MLTTRPDDSRGARSTEFRPAVFIPADPPHDEVTAPGEPAAPIAAAVPARLLTRVGEELLAWARTVLSAAVYATLIVTFGFQIARVDGRSMVPTLEDQDRLIVNKAVYLVHPPRIGDVVMLRYPEEPDKTFVKRVVAEAGDTIRSDHGRVYRNDTLLNDDFISEEYRSYDSWGPRVVRKGYYFVMGDHRNNSLDSRTFGEVPMKYIIGKVQLRWWPLDRAHIF